MNAKCRNDIMKDRRKREIEEKDENKTYKGKEGKNYILNDR